MRSTLGMVLILGIPLSLALAFIVAIVMAAAQAREEFMTECLQYRKQYECTYMWNSSQPDVVYIQQPVVGIK